MREQVLAKRDAARPTRRGRYPGFTLVEVACAMVVLAIILGGVLVAFDLTTSRAVERQWRRRALGVAERQMEYLVSTRQEPNAVDMEGVDEYDPQFFWTLTLERVSVDGKMPRSDLTNTVIEAVVTVQPEDAYAETDAEVRLVRRFADLKPRPGEKIAVPYSPDYEEPQWYLELRQKLGREPTAEETFQALFELEGWSLEMEEGGQIAPIDDGGPDELPDEDTQGDDDQRR